MDRIKHKSAILLYNIDLSNSILFGQEKYTFPD